MNPVLDSTTFIVKTFMRPDCLDRLIQSIHRFYPGARILVADDSHEPVQRSDAKVYSLPYDSGLSYGRNYLMDRVETKYFVLMDDDHVFTEDTKIEDLIATLERGNFDLVGAYINEADGHFPWEGFFESEGSTLTIHPGSRGEVDGILQVDICHNFFAARTETIQKIRWDEHLKMGEHSDFFVRAHEQIRIGVCPDVQAFHAPDRPSNYKSFRKRAKSYRVDFMKKHGYRKVVNEIYPSSSIDLDQKKRLTYAELHSSYRELRSAFKKWVRGDSRV